MMVCTSAAECPRPLSKLIGGIKVSAPCSQPGESLTPNTSSRDLTWPLANSPRAFPGKAARPESDDARLLPPPELLLPVEPPLLGQLPTGALTRSARGLLIMQ